jgi:hypothetical protein
MGILIVDAMSFPTDYPGEGQADFFEMLMSVTDADGTPKSGLSANNVTLTMLEGFNGFEGVTLMSSGGSALGLAGYYSLSIGRDEPEFVFRNGPRIYGLAVVDGTDQGQTLVSADLQGRPPHEVPF